MRLLSITLLAVLAPLATAQDKVTLKNGDVLTGSVKTMAGGKLTLVSPIVGDIVVPIADVANISTAAAVKLVTPTGDVYNRKITGIDNGKLALDGEPALQGLGLGNLESINPPEKVETWSGSLKINAAMSTGNTERRSIGAAFEAVRRTDLDRISADAAWDYAEDKKQDDPTTPLVNEGVWDLTQRRVGAGLKYDRFVSKRVYWLVTSRVLGDTLADIQLRYTAGAGLGYQFIDNANTSLSGEAGLSYFNESYLSATPGVDYVAARVAYKLSHKLGDKSRLLHSCEAFPSTEDANDIYLQARTEVETSLTASMIASLAWIWDYDNTPAPGRERSDHRILLSVGWAF